MESNLSPQAQVIFELIGYVPTPEQAKIIGHECRQILCTGGIQSGKSVMSGVKIVKELPNDLQRAKEMGWATPIVYWLVAADYGRTSQEFNYLRQHLEKLGLLDYASPNVNPGTIKIRATPFKRSKVVAIVRTKSGGDITTLSQESPMGIVICEASQISLEAYWRVQERIAPRQAWLFMSGTMEGSLGWYAAKHDEWKFDGREDTASFELPSYSNTYLFPGGEDHPEIQRMKEEFDEDFYNERILGQPMPPAGLVVKEFNAGLHVRDVFYEPGYPVNLWIDPGYKRSGIVLVVQIYGEGTDALQVRVVDEVYTRNLIDTEIIAMCQAKGWWKDVPNGRHAVDQYATQHQGRAPIVQSWEELGGIVLHSQNIRDVNEGTARLRSFFKINPITNQPFMVIAPRCKGFLSELGFCLNPLDGLKHVYAWKMGPDGDTIGTVPVDAWNDGCKAAIYGLIDRFGYVTDPQNQIRKAKRYKGGRKRSRRDKR